MNPLRFSMLHGDRTDRSQRIGARDERDLLVGYAQPALERDEWVGVHADGTREIRYVDDKAAAEAALRDTK